MAKTKTETQGRRSKGEKTRQIILDAAEELFGNEHYDTISLRDVAQKADVLLGLVSYHFKTKERLFEEVAARRAQESNDARLAVLRQYANPTVEQVLDAFIRPSLEMSYRPEWFNYTRLTNQIYHQDRWRDLNKRLFHDTAMEFYQALLRSMPGSSPEVLSRGFIYSIFVLVGALTDRHRLTELTGDADGSDPQKVYSTFLPFVAGGLRALALAEFTAAQPITAKPAEPASKSPARAPRSPNGVKVKRAPRKTD